MIKLYLPGLFHKVFKHSDFAKINLQGSQMIIQRLWTKPQVR